MSVHDETWDKCSICGKTQTGNNAYQHGLGICRRDPAVKQQQANNLDAAVRAVQSALAKAEVKLTDIGFDNIMSLGQAIEAAGGNAFFVLKDYRDLLTNLERNNISITAKYHGPRKS